MRHLIPTVNKIVSEHRCAASIVKPESIGGTLADGGVVQVECNLSSGVDKIRSASPINKSITLQALIT